MKLLYTLILSAFFISCSTEPEDSETIEDINNICAFEIGESGHHRGSYYKCYSDLSESNCTFLLESENDTIVNNDFYYGNEMNCFDKCEELVVDEFDTCEIM
ncbi:MAG: hypothetical protein HOA66_06715 [Candidatus Marinimicrobia bacterium]|jgi:hypothetical protein|nr:hypothetical protein [Candidatus Neomarinimicrobiota bacterium]